MEDLNVKRYGSGVLRQKAQPIEEITDEIRELAEVMLKVMYESDGVGLAAPQIGVSKRIAVLDVNPYDPDSDPIVLINPEIVERDGEASAEEGCLSVPDVSGEVKRAEKVTVEALNLDGEKIRFEATELLARAVQHEIDHLDGVLFVDHLGRLKQQLIKKHLRKLERENKDSESD